MNVEFTEEYLEQAFEYYNELIFEGKLPVPWLRWSHSKTRLGVMKYKGMSKLGRTRICDFTISISDYYELTKEQLEDVLIHEMIHLSILSAGIEDTSPHGIVFRGMMDKINRTFGRDITISACKQKLQPRVAQQSKDYLILALEMKDGKYFLSSVNPSATGKLAISLARAHEIAHYAWYQSQDEYFNSMPRVRSLRGRQVSEEVYKTMIGKMKLQR